VLRFDGKPVSNASELPLLVGSTKPGRTVVVQVWRKGAPKDLNLTVTEAPTEKAPSKSAGKAGSFTGRLGLSLRDLPESEKKELQISHGVLVENAQGAAARAGMRRGDVIMSLLNRDVKSVE
jgi:serine protease Do